MTEWERASAEADQLIAEAEEAIQAGDHDEASEILRDLAAQLGIMIKLAENK